MGNHFIFPVPDCNYTSETLEPFYQAIPVVEEYYSNKKDKTKVIKRTIPSLMIRTSKKSKYLMIYLHGNSEDLGRIYPRLLSYYEELQIDILAPEYPGYGIYKDQVSSARIIRDLNHIVDYVTRTDGLNYPAENIILMGRSLGTGVAIQLAARCPYLKGMILISAFTSIRDVAKNVAGSLSKLIIPDIFQSSEIISDVKVPTLFIHGREDDLIPFSHSSKLNELCGSSQKRLELREDMSHNRCREDQDIFQPIQKFFVDELQITGLPFHCMKQNDFAHKLTEKTDKTDKKLKSCTSPKCDEMPVYQSAFAQENNKIAAKNDVLSETLEVKERQLFFQ